MNTPHKHAAVIKAWADGAEIQARPGVTSEWIDCVGSPQWYPDYFYRVKPEPKPDVVRFMVCANYFGCKTLEEAKGIAKGHDRSWIVKVVIDGETGAGKSTEVVS